MDGHGGIHQARRVEQKRNVEREITVRIPKPERLEFRRVPESVIADHKDEHVFGESALGQAAEKPIEQAEEVALQTFDSAGEGVDGLNGILRKRSGSRAPPGSP